MAAILLRLLRQRSNGDTGPQLQHACRPVGAMRPMQAARQHPRPNDRVTLCCVDVRSARALLREVGTTVWVHMARPRPRAPYRPSSRRVCAASCAGVLSVDSCPARAACPTWGGANKDGQANVSCPRRQILKDILGSHEAPGIKMTRRHERKRYRCVRKRMTHKLQVLERHFRSKSSLPLRRPLIQLGNGRSRRRNRLSRMCARMRHASHGRGQGGGRTCRT